MLASTKPMRGVDMMKPRLLLCVLALGVYFVRQASCVKRDASSVTKVVLTE